MRVMFIIIIYTWYDFILVNLSKHIHEKFNFANGNKQSKGAMTDDCTVHTLLSQFVLFSISIVIISQHWLEMVQNP